MTILQIAYPFAPVGDDTVGGAEQILTILWRGLEEAGHRVLVVASGSPLNAPMDDNARAEGHRRHSHAITEALAQNQVDIAHFHGVDFHRYLPSRCVPTLVTLHLPPDFYEDAFARSWPSGMFFNCVSQSQHTLLARRGPRIRASVIPNGILVERFAQPCPKENFALSLGRICPEKGFHFAIEAARSADIDWMLAGQIFPYESHCRYFSEVIQPRLDTRRRFLGPLGFDAKRRLLARARCVLISSTVPETSSLVAMEALASGTPVIAFPCGALPEIVEHGRTGFVVDNAAEMAHAIGHIDHIDPEECRRSARERFPADRMVNAYLEMYRSILT